MVKAKNQHKFSFLIQANTMAIYEDLVFSSIQADGYSKTTKSDD